MRCTTSRRPVGTPSFPLDPAVTVLPDTLGALRRSTWAANRPASVKDELRRNLMARLQDRGPLFPGVQGYEGTPPLLGSEPKPVPLQPYDMANDQELFQFEGNKVSADCCPSPFSSDRGCVCLTDKQINEFASRGGNRA